MTERAAEDQAVADRHPDIPQDGMFPPLPYVSVRDGIVADVYTRPDGSLSVTCRECGTALVDDDRGPFYDAESFSGLPHVCGGVLL